MWGFSGCCAQVLTQWYSVSSLLLVLLRMPFAALLFLIAILATQREKLRGIFADKTSLRRCIIFGCIGLFPCQLTYIVAIQLTDAGTGTMLEQFSIVIVMVMTCIFARKLPRACEVAGLVCALGAVVLIATKGDVTSLLAGSKIGADGLAWGMASAVAMTIYVMYPKRLFDKWGVLAPTGVATVAGAVLCLVLWSVLGAFCAVNGSVAFSESASDGAGVVESVASGDAIQNASVEDVAGGEVAGTIKSANVSTNQNASVAGAATTSPTATLAGFTPDEVANTITMPALDAFGWLMLVITILLGTFLAFIFYFKGVHIVGRIRGSQLAAIEPASAAVISAVWLCVPLTWADWTGLVLMIVTVFLMSTAPKPAPKSSKNATAT